MPDPAPTESQIEKTREIAGENSIDYVETLIDKLRDSQWARALELHDAWDEYPAGDVLELQGGRDGLRISSPRSREDIRKVMRLLLGLPELRDSLITGDEGSLALSTIAVF